MFKKSGANVRFALVTGLVNFALVPAGWPDIGLRPLLPASRREADQLFSASRYCFAPCPSYIERDRSARKQSLIQIAWLKPDPTGQEARWSARKRTLLTLAV